MLKSAEHYLPSSAERPAALVVQAPQIARRGILGHGENGYNAMYKAELTLDGHDARGLRYLTRRAATSRGRLSVPLNASASVLDMAATRNARSPEDSSGTATSDGSN